MGWYIKLEECLNDGGGHRVVSTTGTKRRHAAFIVTNGVAERIARQLQVDKFLVKTAQVYSAEEADVFLPEQEEFRRYESSEGNGMVVKGQPVRGCKVLWYSSMVNWNGAVAPCC